MKTRTWAAIALTAAVVLGGCSTDGASDDATTPAPSAEASAAPVPEADVSDVPDVVAEVNGAAIEREEFVSTYEAQFEQYAAQMGGEVDQAALKDQLVQSMVDLELLSQEADARGITVSPEEVETALGEMAEGAGLDVAGVLETLGESGMSEEEVREELGLQTKINKLVEAETGDIADPSDAEVQELYDSLVAQQGEGAEVPSLEEARPQLVDQLRSEQEGARVDELLTRLRESGEVTVHLGEE